MDHAVLQTPILTLHPCKTQELLENFPSRYICIYDISVNISKNNQNNVGHFTLKTKSLKKITFKIIFSDNPLISFLSVVGPYIGLKCSLQYGQNEK